MQSMRATSTRNSNYFILGNSISAKALLFPVLPGDSGSAKPQFHPVPAAIPKLRSSPRESFPLQPGITGSCALHFHSLSSCLSQLLKQPL